MFLFLYKISVGNISIFYYIFFDKNNKIISAFLYIKIPKLNYFKFFNFFIK